MQVKTLEQFNRWVARNDTELVLDHDKAIKINAE